MSGLELVQSAFTGWAPQYLIDTVTSMSFLTHFTAITRGVINLRDLIFFLSIIVAFLYANGAAVEMKKGA